MVTHLKEGKAKADQAAAEQLKQIGGLQQQVTDLVAMNCHVRQPLLCTSVLQLCLLLLWQQCNMSENPDSNPNTCQHPHSHLTHTTTAMRSW